MVKVLGQVLGYLLALALFFAVFAWAWALLPSWAQPLVLAQALALSLVREMVRWSLKAKVSEWKKAQELAEDQILEALVRARLQARSERK